MCGKANPCGHCANGSWSPRNSPSAIVWSSLNADATSACSRPVPYKYRLMRRRARARSEEYTSELQSPVHLVCRLLLEKKKILIHNLLESDPPSCRPSTGYTSSAVDLVVRTESDSKLTTHRRRSRASASATRGVPGV